MVTDEETKEIIKLLFLPKNRIIHHKDCNPHNNNPNNLVCIDQSTHVKAHKMLDDLKFKIYLEKCKT